ncbi:uncharacterized protein LOC128723181 [Anopheles nili]|uniref:uncharacterized protein LOC128723181 n=1 Tax=Anopheles nili TaxID=185578 RepID=UPI00237BA3C7|nr:uncharacterized protein LOC128723181 [Anopheles nili]
MFHVMAKLVLMFSFLLVNSLALPVTENAHGLGAVLSNIAHSFVVVNEEIERPNSTHVQSDEPAALHLESANVLPSLLHIALKPEEQHIKAETQDLVYTNDTDAQGVVKITLLSITEEGSSEEASTTELPDDVTTEESTSEKEEPTTIVTSSSSTPATASTKPTSVLTVLGSDQVDKDKEEEIKENIKEVEAMPVILTVGV